MDTDAHLAAFRDEADRFVGLLEGADLDRPVPACPDWDVADLAYHLGSVFDRLGQMAGQRMTTTDEVRTVVAPDRPADDADLPGWLRERADRMAEVLDGLDPDETVWNFTRTGMVGAWYPRRMHHEVTVHRHDLQEALGEVGTIDDATAVDGVDELLTVLSAAGSRWPGQDPATLRVTEDASGRTWRVRLEPDQRPSLDGGDGEGDGGADARADVTLRGNGATLLLALWRRRPLDTVTLTGDGALAAAMLDVVGR